MAAKKSAKLPLKKFAMVGTGIQGTQIAMIAARTGYEVTVFDPREGAFRQTFEKLRADLKAKRSLPSFLGTSGRPAPGRSARCRTCARRSRTPTSSSKPCPKV